MVLIITLYKSTIVTMKKRRPAIDAYKNNKQVMISLLVIVVDIGVQFISPEFYHVFPWSGHIFRGLSLPTFPGWSLGSNGGSLIGYGSTRQRQGRRVLVAVGLQTLVFPSWCGPILSLLS